MNEYKLRKREPVCAISGEPFQPGDVVVSAVFLEDESFVRRDMHERAFEDPDACFCYWKTVQEAPAPEAPRLDLDQARTFLEKLLAEEDPARHGLVYTLVLLLGRKRRLKIKETRRVAGGEVLEIIVPGDEEDALHIVSVPVLDAAEVDRLQAEIADLFDFPAAS